MKKKWIVFWIVSAGLFITAIAFSVTGLVLGATPAIPREVQIGTSWNDHTNVEDLQLAISDDEVTNHSYRTLYNNIVNLDIEIGGISTVIREWNGTGIVVDTSNLSRDQRRQINVRQRGNELEVTTGRFSFNFGRSLGNQGTEVLVIQVPQGTEFDSVSLDIGAGQISVDQLIANEVEITVGAGQIVVDHLKANILEVDIGAGQGTIGELEVVRTNMEVGAGQLDVTGTIEERAELDCGVGAIIFNVRGRHEDFGHDISVGIGEATFGNIRVAGLGGDSEGNQHLDKSIEIDVGIGNVTVNFLY
jgi:hypothetical protein